MKNYKNIKEYISAQPKDRKAVLKEMYEIIKTVVPDATETIKYGMPTFVGNKNLVHFAGMKSHLGFYPTPSVVDKFSKELSKYSTSKGCVRFPYNEPLPKSLITKMVKFRKREDMEGR